MSLTAHILAWPRAALHSLKARIAVVVLAEAVYAALVLALRGPAGDSIGVLAVIPVLLTGALVGSVPAASLAVANAFVNWGLFALLGVAGAALVPYLTVHLAPALLFATLGGMMGSLTELARKKAKAQRDLESSLAREREANLALREREAQLAMAQEVAQLGGWVADFGSGREWWSLELCRLFGLDPGEAGELGGLWLDLVHPDDRQRVVDTILHAVVGQQPTHLEHRVIRTDGEIRYAVGRIRPVLERGRVCRVVAAVQDVTELKKMQEQLAAAERSASLGALVSRIAHEINNPLACVVSNVNFALGQLDEPVRDGAWMAELREALRETLTGAERVRRSVQDLRSLVQPAETSELDEEPRVERQSLRAPAPGERAPAASE